MLTAQEEDAWPELAGGEEEARDEKPRPPIVLYEGDDAFEEELLQDRPAFQFLRYKEDWRGFEGGGGAIDDLKYVSLSDDGSVWASFGGHVRSRWEFWRNFNFSAPPGVEHDDDFRIGRVLLHADVHFGERYRVFGEIKSAWATDRDLPGGTRPLDVDDLALEQFFVDVDLPLSKDSTLTLRPGRQALQFGRQRLVSPSPWGNTLRRWDGVQAIWTRPGWTVSGFATQFVPVDRDQFNEPDSGTKFSGIYTTRNNKEGPGGQDYYWLFLQNADVLINATAGDEDRHTVGARVWNTARGGEVDYDVEAAYQFGDVGSESIGAYMLGAQVGYTRAEEVFSPRYWIGLDYATGDGTPGGKVETFNQLFPQGHRYFGAIDAIGRQNIIDLSFGVDAHPSDDISITVADHIFWVDESNDSLYNAGGGIVRPAGVSTASSVGMEIDITAKIRFSRHWSGLFGYGHFFAGTLIDDSIASQDNDFWYLNIQYTF